MITIIAIIFFYIAPIVLLVKIDNPLIILLPIGIWIINTVVLYFYCGWWGQLGSTTPKLSYRAFIKLYNVMPEDFGLNEFSVNYKYRGISFKTYIDYCKYRKFIKRYKEQEEEMERTETQADLVKMLQRDLAAKQEESDQWVKKRLEKITYLKH